MSAPECSTDLGRSPFYLTQRLTRRGVEHLNGFDALFGCQYMGSAEFEWGALPESLGRLRAERRRLVVHSDVVHRGHTTRTVYVVGDERRVELVPSALTAWMTEPYPGGKERTYFPEQVTGATAEWMRDTHAWWALRSDVMWALDLGVAEELLRAVRDV